ncbi:MAG: 50S ribosomal protein L5, partial [Candidatus Omnitrophota bacterium]
MIPRLLKRYQEEIVPQVQKAFDIKSAMAVPLLQKIVINMGVGEAIGDIRLLETSMEELALIVG